MRGQCRDQNLIAWSVNFRFSLVLAKSMLYVWLTPTYGRYIKMFIYFVWDADKRERKDLQKVERGERIRAKGTDIFPAP